MKKTLSILILAAFAFAIAGCTKYKDGPAISFRSKKNRLAHQIGKKWKSEKYLLQMGQEGYALSISGVPGFFDVGDWRFNDSKEILIFDSETYPDYEFVIHKLAHRKLKLEGAFPFDDNPITHEFDMQGTVDEVK